VNLKQNVVRTLNVDSIQHYQPDLDNLIYFARTLPNTKFMAQMKVLALVMLNSKYETVMLNRNLEQHPYTLTRRFIGEALGFLSQCAKVSWIEEDERTLESRSMRMEENHQELFQKLWVNFSAEEYRTERIGRYKKRIELNKLQNAIKGKACLDCGCGHGNFALALCDFGADFVLGVDYGKASIEFANAMRERLGYAESQVEFREADIYELPVKDETFDFAIQNGVFHHLEDEDSAYREVWRALKPGGLFWIYTDAEGAIGPTLFDASQEICKDIPSEYVIQCLKQLNISTNKRYHFGDGFNAKYRHTSYEAMTKRLLGYGFGNFRRLIGGFPTDFDHDVIAQDRYGKEKFGSGDIRILAQKL
jgi:ubiquinone/menaquinone biosynthesis C-methylase UbiE